jgi:hypothetical protein
MGYAVFMGGAPTRHEDELVRTTELATVNDVLTDHEFVNCEIVGPAILVPLAGVEFIDSVFEGDPEAMLWEIPEYRTRVIGGIGLQRCRFRGCRFSRIGFAGPPDFVKAFKSGTAA